jgi:hypothetical protein
MHSAYQPVVNVQRKTMSLPGTCVPFAGATGVCAAAGEEEMHPYARAEAITPHTISSTGRPATGSP